MIYNLGSSKTSTHEIKVENVDEEAKPKFKPSTSHVQEKMRDSKKVFSA